MNATALQEARKDALAAEQARLKAEERAAGQAEGQSEGEEEEDDDDEDLADENSGRATPPPDTPQITDDEDETDEGEDGYASDRDYLFSLNEEDTEDGRDPRARVLSVLELEDLFVRAAPNLSGERSLYNYWGEGYSSLAAEFTDSTGQPPSKLVVGLVGYPNVGKSSTINSLIGEKKVSVSSTPGKTKHFQTIQLSSSLVLCDCPGLVFPQFATTRADLVCDGVLPIDQLREHTGPTALVVKRIPKEVLEAVYGLSIKPKSIEEGGDGRITAENFLIAYASKLYPSYLIIIILINVISRQGLHAVGPGQPRRSTSRTVYPQGLRDCQASLLPSTAWNPRRRIQRGHSWNCFAARRRQEACTYDPRCKKCRHLRCLTSLEPDFHCAGEWA